MMKMFTRSSIESFDLDQYNNEREKSYEWCENHWGVWPPEKQFLHVVEETGEFIDEILRKDETKQVDELWDLNFTYLTFIENIDIEIKDEEKFSIMKYVLTRLKSIDVTLKDLSLLFVSEISKENKVQRKLSWRKDNFKYSELDLKKSKILNLFLLHMLSSHYSSNVKELIDNSIQKYDRRDF